jgi:hypothetical protein
LCDEFLQISTDIGAGAESSLFGAETLGWPAPMKFGLFLAASTTQGHKRSVKSKKENQNL